MPPALQDKTIVVIGGTTGLGLSAARAIVAAGGRVVALGRNEDSAAAARDVLGDAGRVLTGDATEEGTAERAIETAIAQFGGFDGLYHVAGGSGRRMGDGPLDAATLEGWDYTLRLNLTSMFLSNRAAVRAFLKRDQGVKPKAAGGVVLNMGSVLGWSPSPAHFSTFAYTAAKSAIVGMTKQAAAQYAAANVRFNVIAPALVETPMAKRAADDEQILAFIKTKQPLDGGRIGRPDDLDAAAVFLLSDASRFVTGQVLAVDGGWCVSEGQRGTGE
ncbi:MAG: SDR family NAD(P)-dependent oxidoreductase [Phycisphaerae bacterium]|nr:SDR family oxidoreductase [Tepidisphaeraceae bacterium]